MWPASTYHVHVEGKIKDHATHAICTQVLYAPISPRTACEKPSEVDGQHENPATYAYLAQRDQTCILNDMDTALLLDNHA